MRARFPSGQRGVALVLVIWLATLLAVVASSFLFAARSDALVIRNSLSMARAEAIAEAAVQRAVFELYRVDNATDAWRRDGVAREWTFEGVPVRIELRDESAKIDINTASDNLLRGLLVSVGLEQDEANRVLDAILDWRDPDKLTRLNGAEEAEYQAAGVAWRPENAPFQAIEELQLVLGMRPEIYRSIAPHITVHSRQVGITPQVASRDVLLAIPGMRAEIVDAYIARREEAVASRQPVPGLPEAAQYASPPSSTVASIHAEVLLEDGTAVVRDAVALLRPIPRRPVTFLSWRAGSLPEPKPEGEEAAAGHREKSS